MGVGEDSGPVTTKDGLGPNGSEELGVLSSKLSAGLGVEAAGSNGSGSGVVGASLSGSAISSSSFFLLFFDFLALAGFTLLRLLSSDVEDSDDPVPKMSSIAIPFVVTLAPGLLSPQPSQNLRKSSFSAPHEGHFQFVLEAVPGVEVSDELPVSDSKSSDEDLE